LCTEFGKEIKLFCNLTIDTEEQRVSPTTISLNHNQILRLPSFADQDMQRRVHQQILNIKLRPLIESIPLTQRQRAVLDLRYGFSRGYPYTYKQIGTLLGVCRERVRQIEHTTLEKIQHFCGDELFKLADR
jgi:RNA polymerase sigma factor (sigma-70 family)